MFTAFKTFLREGTKEVAREVATTALADMIVHYALFRVIEHVLSMF